MSYIPSSPNNPSQISPPSKLFNSNPLYLGQADLTHLGAFLAGYFFARRQSGIPETQQEKEFAEFQHWVEKKFNVNYSQPWEKIIRFFSPDETASLQQFFILFHEFSEFHQTHSTSSPIAH